MKKEVEFIAAFAAFAVFLAASLFAYNKLSETSKQDNVLTVTESSGEISPQSKDTSAPPVM